MLRVHRWLGTAIGLSGLALAIWAWKRPEEDRRPGMIVALAGITAAIIVQGWFGGALVHGIDHMDW
jgi:heme A synthase